MPGNVKKGLYFNASNQEAIKKFESNTPEEIAKVNELSKLVLSFQEKVFNIKEEIVTPVIFNYDLCKYGYKNDYGYYLMHYDDWNKLLVNCYGEDIESAFVRIAQSIINKQFNEIPKADKKGIACIYKERFPDNKYANNIYHTEYELQCFDKYYDGNIPEQIITDEERKLNNICYNGQQLLKYDFENKQFVYSEQQVNPKKKIKK